MRKVTIVNPKPKHCFVKYLFIIILTACATCSWGQHKEGHDLGATAVFISAHPSVGTGFYAFDTTTGNIFLITAAHVLVDPQTSSLYSAVALITSYRLNSLTDSKDSFYVDLQAAHSAKLFKFNSKSDVAVILIGHSKNGAITYPSFFKRISKDRANLNLHDLASGRKMNSLSTMDDVYMAGYPVSLQYNRVFDSTRPLIRHGIVSGVDFKTKWIITDAPGYHGNSGGPVVVRELINEPGGIKAYYRLIGVASMIIPLEEKWFSMLYGHQNTTVYNSGYSVIAPIDAVLDQISLVGK